MIRMAPFKFPEQNGGTLLDRLASCSFITSYQCTSTTPDAELSTLIPTLMTWQHNFMSL